MGSRQPVSAYIHVPYCDKLCWFCGCHTKQVNRYEPVRQYVATLTREIAIWRTKVPVRPQLSRIHLGGGSPSLLKGVELRILKAALDATFEIARNAEVSIELDPSDITSGQVENLLAFGITRASIGVQDFDPLVQAAINRPQSYEVTAGVVAALRESGISSINIDALYGLPFQTEDRLVRTIDKVLSLKPERIAMFGYAHVPWLKAHQRLIDESALPDERERFEQAQLAGSLIVSAGYVPVGIDHFALAHDSLAVAARDGRLRRNFQGYTDDAATIMLPLGPSSIGQFADGYVQNEVATGLYTKRIESGELPLARGLLVSPSDKMRGAVIERLMCDFSFSFAEMKEQFGEDIEPLLNEAMRIPASELGELCEIVSGRFAMKAEARSLVRLVASRFDAWFLAAPQRYSAAV